VFDLHAHPALKFFFLGWRDKTDPSFFARTDKRHPQLEDGFFPTVFRTRHENLEAGGVHATSSTIALPEPRLRHVALLPDPLRGVPEGRPHNALDKKSQPFELPHQVLRAPLHEGLAVRIRVVGLDRDDADDLEEVVEELESTGSQRFRVQEHDRDTDIGDLEALVARFAFDTHHPYPWESLYGVGWGRAPIVDERFELVRGRVLPGRYCYRTLVDLGTDEPRAWRFGDTLARAGAPQRRTRYLDPKSR
jgi:hypothetical protein